MGKRKVLVKKAPLKQIKPPVRETTHLKDYGPIRASHPQRLFGLIVSDAKSQKIVKQVKCPTKVEAIGLFQKSLKTRLLLSDNIQRERAEQVCELGGFDLPYVSKMKVGVVYDS